MFTSFLRPVEDKTAYEEESQAAINIDSEYEITIRRK